MGSAIQVFHLPVRAKIKVFMLILKARHQALGICPANILMDRAKVVNWVD